MVLGDVVSKLETIVLIWGMFQGHNLGIIQLNSTTPFIWWCQFISWIKLETRLSPLLNLKVALMESLQVKYSLTHNVLQPDLAAVAQGTTRNLVPESSGSLASGCRQERL